MEGVKILVEAGADINYVDEFNQSALRTACLGNQIEIVKYLLDRGVEFRKPLMSNSERGPLYIQHFLRSMVFELDSKDYKVKMEVVEFLRLNGMDYSKAEIPKHYYDLYPKEYLDKY